MNPRDAPNPPIIEITGWKRTGTTCLKQVLRASRACELDP
jgi:hypothetical protein